MSTHVLQLGLTIFALVAAGSPAPAEDTLFDILSTDTDNLGWAVASVGDVNGDGTADFLVGLQSWSEATGAARVYSGADASALVTVFGENESDVFGRGLCALGDVDGDGLGDFAVGAPWHDVGGLPNVGATYVFSGATGALLRKHEGTDADGEFGFALAGGIDLDGDGVGDLLVGARLAHGSHLFRGTVHAFSGADGALIHMWSGEDGGGYFGQAIALPGDLTGDGMDDVVISSPGESDTGFGSGTLRIFSGADRSLAAVIWGPEESILWGNSVAAAGDVDADGWPDLIVGAPYDDPHGDRSGSARILSGALCSEILRFDGHHALDHFGWAVAGIGDTDGDGHDDVLVGAPRHDVWGEDAGAAWVFSGAKGAQLAYLHAEDPGANFGQSVAAIGDVDGDGLSDMIIGAPKYDAHGAGVGLARVVAQQCPGPTRYCTAGVNSTGEAASIGYEGSLNRSANSLYLTAEDCPAGEAGLFFYGPETQELPFGDGYLCVHPGTKGIYRLYPPQLTSAAGEATRWLDFESPPAGWGPGIVEAGVRWNYQFWFRDTGGAGFNLTDALSVVLCP